MAFDMGKVRSMVASLGFGAPSNTTSHRHAATAATAASRAASSIPGGYPHEPTSPVKRTASVKKDVKPARKPSKKSGGPDGWVCRPADVLIAVMGVTGAGKSTFINYLSEMDVEIGDELKSCTSKVSVYPALLPSGRRIFLMDTPGFDDTFKSDTDILREIASWLSEISSLRIYLSGIVYLHRIQDVRFTGAAMKNLRMFKKLCGGEGLGNVVLATTFWSKVTQEEGESREYQLSTEEQFWKPMTDQGSTILRHDREAQSALEIIEFLINKRSKVELAIQKELKNGASLEETAAGREVEAQVAEMKALWAKEKKALEQDMKEALEARDKEAQEQIKKEREEIEKKIRESDESLKRLQTNNSQLADQLQQQREEMRSRMRLLNYLEAKEERREKRLYNRMNPFHKRYDEKYY